MLEQGQTASAARMNWRGERYPSALSGVISSLLLLVLDQLLIDAALARPAGNLVGLASSRATTALRCEVARRQHQA
ncbi:hypothetical protein QMO56_22540 [Roseomonas sp. E05]|uniref:hypothetical protein n=1 Tax=Roseomonas sp. E05 TaxID=3046310 RepID=UPI0024BBA274|nr:hypothetical protein [Roseomonas sp. E05]MDJ0390899.1 hypothetical protein [Roseomonas sp. E05]